MYKNSDIVLLDDPLSAVDQQVGKHIFTQCIKDYYKDKTVLFVTHQLQVSPSSNCILFFNTPSNQINKLFIFF